MDILKLIRTQIKKNMLVRRFVGHKLAPSGLFDWYFKNYKLSKHWQERNQIVISCPDNGKIPVVANAGEIENGKQFMHNGLKINLGSYYGPEVSQLLLHNRGIHEPQEEYAFGQVLSYLPENAIMIELGAFWSFYSMWFQQRVPKARNYLVEPELFNMISGQNNFRINGFSGEFINAFVGLSSGFMDRIPIICIDDFCREKGIDHLHLLHSDIQGFELDMLKGANQMLSSKKIDWIFISTHSNELHRLCINSLEDKGYLIVASADKNQTYSEDGLIVAKSIDATGPSKIEISLRKHDV